MQGAIQAQEVRKEEIFEQRADHLSLRVYTPQESILVESFNIATEFGLIELTMQKGQVQVSTRSSVSQPSFMPQKHSLNHRLSYSSNEATAGSLSVSCLPVLCLFMDVR